MMYSQLSGGMVDYQLLSQGEKAIAGVPDRIWQGLKTAPSHGHYLATMVKGKYMYEKL